MDRSKDIEEFAKTYRRERKEYKRICLSENISRLIPSFQNKINYLIDKQIQRQKQKADKIKFIFLCRLMSGGYTKNYEAILGMSSSMLYLDEGRSYVYWLPELLYDCIEQDMNIVKKKLQKQFLRLKESELFSLKQKLLSDDWELLHEFYSALSQRSVDLILNSPLQLENEILFLYGNYMDHLKVVWHADSRKEKTNE